MALFLLRQFSFPKPWKFPTFSDTNMYTSTHFRYQLENAIEYHYSPWSWNYKKKIVISYCFFVKYIVVDGEVIFFLQISFEEQIVNSIYINEICMTIGTYEFPLTLVLN